MLSGGSDGSRGRIGEEDWYMAATELEGGEQTVTGWRMPGEKQMQRRVGRARQWWCRTVGAGGQSENGKKKKSQISAY